jgi:hypothetical protein
MYKIFSWQTGNFQENALGILKMKLESLNHQKILDESIQYWAPVKLQTFHGSLLVKTSSNYI